MPHTRFRGTNNDIVETLTLHPLSPFIWFRGTKNDIVVTHEKINMPRAFGFRGNRVFSSGGLNS